MCTRERLGTPATKKQLVLLCFGILLGFPNLASAAVNALVDVQFAQGTNLFANPLQAGDNSLSTLLPSAPDGTTVSLWNPDTLQFDQVSTKMAGSGWTTNLVLNPGKGALLRAPVGFSTTFSGIVLAPNGLVYDPGQPLDPLAQFGGRTGLHLLSSKFPVTLSSPNLPVYLWILGRGPQTGEQFIRFDQASQRYRTNVFTATGWSQGEPVLPVGESAFFNTTAVPVLHGARSGGQFVIWWPITATNFIPETSASVSAGAIWTQLPGGIIPIGTNYFQTNLISGPTGFFRLRLQ